MAIKRKVLSIKETQELLTAFDQLPKLMQHDTSIKLGVQ